MTEYRRSLVKGGTYFFTVVTHERAPILCTELGRKLLKEAFEHEQRRRPFETLAIVLLPDHLHCLWELPPGDPDFSTRWKQIKKEFSMRWLSSGGLEGQRSSGKTRKGERGVWQRRFWEHLIRNETDLKNHMDYIHFNPVKHGLTAHPLGWEWSSLRDQTRQGAYDKDWGSAEPKAITAMDCE